MGRVRPAAQRPGRRAAQRPGRRAAQRPARGFRPALLLGALVLALYGLGAIGISKPADGLVIFGLALAALGLVIARRQPGNSVAWLLLATSAVLVFYEDAANYAAIWLAGGAWEVSTAPVVVDGKGQLVNNPGPPGVPLIVFVILLGAVPVLWVSFVLRQVLSWRRATGERRAQLKWLMAGGAAAVAGLTGTVLLSSNGGLIGALDDVMLAFGLFSLPVCISFAIFKYHLYDIDRIISRTLAYTLVTGLLVGLYAGLVLLATEVLSFHSSVAVAASTLAVAALFNPVRRRVQRVVDRRFNRARYDADRTVVAFAARLQDAVDLDSIRDDLAGSVYRTLEPAHVSVWLNPEDPQADRTARPD